MNGDIRLGRWFGVDVRVDSSWLLMLALMLASLTFLFLLARPTWLPGEAFILAIATGALLAASIVAREAVHAITSYALGVPVAHTTFYLFGSIAHSTSDRREPWREAVAAASGPVTSFVIGALTLLAAAFLTHPASVSSFIDLGVIRGVSTLALACWAVGIANVAMGAFNLLPAYPLDGGRIVRAGLWRVYGDRTRATAMAARIGRAVGVALLVFGVVSAFGLMPGLGPYGIVAGVWLVFLGASLFMAASAHVLRSIVEERLRDVRVSQLMRLAVVVDDDSRIARVVSEHFVRGGENAIAVRRGSESVGVMRIEDARAIDAREWEERTVAEAMVPFDNVPEQLDGNGDAAEALRALHRTGWNALPVVSGRRIIGFYDHRDVSRWIEASDPAPSPGGGSLAV